MQDFTKQYPDRKFDVMFYADDERVTVERVQAFLCPPNGPETRWVPEKGYSVSVGGTLAKDSDDAHKLLYRKLAKERTELLRRLAKLDAYLDSK